MSSTQPTTSPPLGPSDTPEGACIWLTGRSGAGKSTVTAALLPLLSASGRVVTVLDTVPLLAKLPGERTSEGKLLRKAFVASEIVRHGGLVICVTVSSRRAVREKAREIVGTTHFLEVYFQISLEAAEGRRVQRGSSRPLKKRLKAALRPLVRPRSNKERGAYEPPLAPEVTLDALNQSPEQSAQSIVNALIARGLNV